MIEQDGEGRETGTLCWGSELSVGLNAKVAAVQADRHPGGVQLLALTIKKETRKSHISFSTHAADCS